MESIFLNKLNFVIEPFYYDGRLLGYIVYYPVSGLMDMKTEYFVQLEFARVGCIFEKQFPENQELIEQHSLKKYSKFFPINYVTEVKQYHLTQENHVHYFSKFHEQILMNYTDIKKSLPFEDVKFAFLSYEFSSQPFLISPSNETPSIPVCPP